MRQWLEMNPLWVTVILLSIFCVVLVLLILKKWSELKRQRSTKNKLLSQLTKHYEHHTD